MVTLAEVNGFLQVYIPLEPDIRGEVEDKLCALRILFFQPQGTLQLASHTPFIP
jgi:hypothetical protein